MTSFVSNLIRCRWLLAADSSQLARLYLLTLGFFALSGTIAALVLQLELGSASSHLVSAHRFGQLFTHHGLVMAFVVLLPLIPAVFGNLALPGAVGARGLAGLGWNRAAWVLHAVGGVAVIVAVESGAYDSGWTLLMPAGSSQLYPVLLGGLLLVAVATFIINWSVVATILSRKHRSIPLSNIPIIAWFFLFGALVVVLVSPIRCFTLVVQILHQVGLGDFLSPDNPESITRYQRLFWAYAGTATSAAALPALGITLHIGATHGRANVFLHRVVVFAGLAVGLLSLVSWGQHLLTAADSQKLAVTGSFFGLLASVPTGIILLSLLVMLFQARSRRAVPVLIAWLQIGLITLGSLAGLVLAAPATGAVHHNSYLATGHLHLLVVGGIVLSFFSGIFHWIQLPDGRATTVGRLAIGALALGVLLTYVPMLVNGLGGSPKALFVYPDRYASMHTVSSIGTLILTLALLTLIGLIGHASAQSRTVETSRPKPVPGETFA